MLKIKNLKASIKGKKILNGIDLHVNKGELVVIFGPNGSGKSSLLKSIMGLNDLKIDNGEIWFKNKKINNLSIDEKSKMGIGLMFQKAPKIKGVSLEKLIKSFNTNEKEIKKETMELKMADLVKRDVNDNFSGGELKRSELLQLCLQEVDLYLFDEPDSGVDVENLKLLAEKINSLVKNKKSALLITHGGEILKYIGANRAYVMMDGKIYCEGRARKMFKSISRYGYEGCIKCHKRQK